MWIEGDFCDCFIDPLTGEKGGREGVVYYYLLEGS